MPTETTTLALALTELDILQIYIPEEICRMTRAGFPATMV